MQRDVNKKSSHPSSRELADFVDGKLNRDRRAEITKHLIACDECSDVVALVMKYGEKKTHLNNDSKNEHKAVDDINKPQGLRYANNWLYSERVRAIVLSGLVASVVLFLVMPTKEITPPFIAFCTSTNQCSPAFKAFDIAEDSSVVDINKTNQEINTILRELVKSTDMSYLKEFNVAEEKLKQKRFDEARELYQKAMNIVDNDMPNLDKKEKSRELIVITYKILLLGMAEGDKESVNDYKDVLLDKVRSFKRRWLLDGKN